MEKLPEPWRLFGQIDLTSFEAGALGFHAYDFVTFGLDPDGQWNARLRLGPELLHQLQPRAGLFDENLVGRVLRASAMSLCLNNGNSNRPRQTSTR